MLESTQGDYDLDTIGTPQRITVSRLPSFRWRTTARFSMDVQRKLRDIP